MLSAKYFILSCLLHFYFLDEISKPTIPLNSITNLQDTLSWKEIIPSKHNILLDLKYGTVDNFMHKAFYNCPRCYLKKNVANAIINANKALVKLGYKIKLFDCYRPLNVQKKMWQHYPNPSYVTPPWKGSMHNRGLAVDLCLTDLEGNEINMGTPFDDFSRKSHVHYLHHSKAILDARKLLKITMNKYGLKGIRTEWWHYSMRQKSAVIAYDWNWKCL